MKFLAAIFLVAAFLVTSEPTFAQIETCQSITSTVNSLTRNRSFRNLRQNIDDVRRLAGDLQETESLFVRGGCQQVLDAGKTLPSQCRTVARRILRARETYNDLAAEVANGQAVGAKREEALQQYARFACGNGSNAHFEDNVTTQPQRPFQSLFDRLFGGPDDLIVDEGWGYYGGSTLRSVCVRTCDGYFWPVSFSTVEQYLPDDAAQCQSQCPGAEVDLFYYQNPGQDPEDMINLAGTPYQSLPNAFRYRNEYDKSCTCKSAVQLGTIAITAATEGGQSRAMIDFGGLNFPLPQRDPRKPTNATVATAIHVPLPRPRPTLPGEQPPRLAIVPPIVATGPISDRLIQSNGRRVRLVGPDTPYGQSAASGI